VRRTAPCGASNLVAPLVSKLPDIEWQAVAAIRAGVPDYSSLGDSEAMAEWADSVADMLSFVLGAVSEGRRCLAPTEAQAVRVTDSERCSAASASPVKW
jgi:hypothetical protein